MLGSGHTKFRSSLLTTTVLYVVLSASLHLTWQEAHPDNMCLSFTMKPQAEVPLHVLLIPSNNMIFVPYEIPETCPG